MSETAPRGGLYGKAPAFGDFVVRRLPSTFVRPWDDWLSRSLAASRQQIGEVIHKAKDKMNIGAAEDVIFDRSGGMWDSRTGEYIGKIWEPL